MLRDTESDLFLVLCQQHIQEVLPLLYTPTVAEACMQWSTLLRRSPGLYISLSDKVRTAFTMATCEPVGPLHGMTKHLQPFVKPPNCA